MESLRDRIRPRIWLRVVRNMYFIFWYYFIGCMTQIAEQVSASIRTLQNFKRKQEDD
jgi:hypothetical protein